jgi:hypothetical protein
MTFTNGLPKMNMTLIGYCSKEGDTVFHAIRLFKG